MEMHGACFGEDHGLYRLYSFTFISAWFRSEEINALSRAATVAFDNLM